MTDSKEAAPREIWHSLLNSEPVMWPVYLEDAASVCLEHYGFDSLAEFITAPVSEKGLGMTIAEARYLLRYSKRFEGKAVKLLAELGPESEPLVYDGDPVGFAQQMKNRLPPEELKAIKQALEEV